MYSCVCFAAVWLSCIKKETASYSSVYIIYEYVVCASLAGLSVSPEISWKSKIGGEESVSSSKKHFSPNDQHVLPWSRSATRREAYAALHSNEPKESTVFGLYLVDRFVPLVPVTHINQSNTLYGGIACLHGAHFVHSRNAMLEHVQATTKGNPIAYKKKKTSCTIVCFQICVKSLSTNFCLYTVWYDYLACIHLYLNRSEY